MTDGVAAVLESPSPGTAEGGLNARERNQDAGAAALVKTLAQFNDVIHCASPRAGGEPGEAVARPLVNGRRDIATPPGQDPFALSAKRWQD